MSSFVVVPSNVYLQDSYHPLLPVVGKAPIFTSSLEIHYKSQLSPLQFLPTILTTGVDQNNPAVGGGVFGWALKNLASSYVHHKTAPIRAAASRGANVIQSAASNAYKAASNFGQRLVSGITGLFNSNAAIPQTTKYGSAPPAKPPYQPPEALTRFLQAQEKSRAMQEASNRAKSSYFDSNPAYNLARYHERESMPDFNFIEDAANKL